MKIGIVGKGGVGKTSVSALLTQAYAEQGQRVLAVDTDSNPNLGLSLGLDAAALHQAPLLPRSLAVGAGDGEMSPAQLISAYGLATPSGATLVQSMLVDEAGGGCMCGSHASVRSMLGATIDDHVDVAVIDMEAGLEHLSRSGGTLAYADVLLAVMEPTQKALHAARRVRELAEELGIPRVYGVGNKSRGDDDHHLFAQMAAAEGMALAGVIPYDDDVVTVERDGGTLGGSRGLRARQAVADIIGLVSSPEEERAALRRMRDRVERRIAELQAG